MNRKKALSYIDLLLPNEDVFIYLGNLICCELPIINRKSVLFVPDVNVDFLAIALGMAITTTKRIVIVCEDYILLKYFQSVLQIGVSGCKNIVIVLLLSGEYTESGGQPTIYNSFRSMYGVFFNMGILVQDYTKYFKNKTTLANIFGIASNYNSPAMITIKIDDNRLYNISEYTTDISSFIMSLGE